jgi:hypothetical protein
VVSFVPLQTDESRPDGDQDIKDAPFLTSGADGAFVTALEDEFSGSITMTHASMRSAYDFFFLSYFLAVRGAAVTSITDLSLHCTPLATKAMDYLVDMCNDDIEEVRCAETAKLAMLRTVCRFV